MKFFEIQIFVVGFVFVACDSSSSVGTDVGNAIENEVSVETELMTDQAEEGLLEIVGGSSGIATSSSLTYNPSFAALTNDEIGDLFRESYRRPRLFRPSRDCPSTSISGSTLTRTFDNCRPFPFRRLTYDGTSTLTVNADSSDEGDLSVISRESSITRDLRITNTLGQVSEVDESHTSTTSGSFPTIEHTVDVDLSRTLKNSAGTTLRAFEIEGSLEYDFTGSGSTPDQVVVNGSYTTLQSLLNRQVSTTVKDVIYDTSCCHPISGSLSKTITDTSTNETSSVSVEFSSTCGSVTAEGSSFSLEACE